MKRKALGHEAAEAAERDDPESDAKRARAQAADDAATTAAAATVVSSSTADSSAAAKRIVIELDETIDVEAFFKQDCDRAAERLLEQTKARCAELRREFERSKQAILSGVAAEKENQLNDRDATAASRPHVFDVTIKCVAGPYKGHVFALHLDAETRRSCLIGRSTGRKFRAPNGLSLPKDAELSTTHAQLRLEPDGRVVFVDLDSTNGSYINDESVEPHEPRVLSAAAPNRVFVGGSDLLVSLTRRP